jgi:Kinesin motor domain
VFVSGSGKTYTMQPLPLKASQDIFRLMHYTYKNQGFHLFVSFFEIYGGKLFDLLGEKKCVIILFYYYYFLFAHSHSLVALAWEGWGFHAL